MNSRLPIWLAIPVVVLGFLTLTHALGRSTGQEYEFAIEGYDPRSLISGHYLQFQVNYGVDTACTNPSPYVCLSEPRVFSYGEPGNCSNFIKGQCEGGRFIAGIEKYYIPENRAQEFENMVREKRARIKVSVSSSGNAQIKSMLIDGREVK